MVLLSSLAAAVLTIPVAAASEEEAYVIPEGGARVVAAEQAPERVVEAAKTLAAYLHRMQGGKFELVRGGDAVGAGDSEGAILVGLVEHHPTAEALPAPKREITAGEQYVIRSDRDGVQLLGRSALAVEHAVWDLLHRLGHRQFFPGANWEIVPEWPDLRIDINVVEEPDYATRRIWYTYYTWKENKPDYHAWVARNRLGGGFELNTGHVYGRIIRERRAHFDAHPEYLALLDGKRVSPDDETAKFCISNPALRKLIAEWALDFFANRPQAGSVSVDPSDGGGWCECEPCVAIGSPSDRVLRLANEVAEALAGPCPDKYVATYAYNHYATPPTRVTAHPRVIINAATAFLKDITVDEVIGGWKKAGVQQFGIRGYFSIIHWDQDLPGAARSSNHDYLADAITGYYNKGALFYTAESSENFGPNGLGYYLAARMMWDVNEAQVIDELADDFFEKAFGEARAPMERFYKLITVTNERRPKMSSDLIGRMYRLLNEAQTLTGDPAVLRRLDDLILYTRYVELYADLEAAASKHRQDAFRELIRHAYRARRSMMVHSLAIYRSFNRRHRHRGVSVPGEAHWLKPEAQNPWKTSASWTREELDGFVTAGIERQALLDFEPREFTTDLVPATPLGLGPTPNLTDADTSRGEHDIYCWFNEPGQITLDVTGGLIASYRDRGPATFTLTYVPPSVDEMNPERQTDRAQTEPDGVQRTVQLKTTHTGLHRLTISDRMDQTQVTWRTDLPRVKSLARATDLRQRGRRRGVFYVPKGTPEVAGFANLRPDNVTLADAAGNVLHTFKTGPHHFKVIVPEGKDGQVWQLRNLAGQLELMTVPPYLADSPANLLLPREVVEADTP